MSGSGCRRRASSQKSADKAAKHEGIAFGIRFFVTWARSLLQLWTMGPRKRKRVWLSAALLIAVGCGDDKGDATDLPAGGDSANGGQGAGDGSNGGGSGGAGGGNNGGGLASETEEPLSFELPQAGASSVYVPNPVTDRVAVVNATTFAIETVRAGKAPTYTGTVPGKDIAIVLNVGTRDASLLRTNEGRTEVRSLPVGHDANAIAVAPDGQHALIYFEGGNTDQSAQSFQDVTVVDLTPGSEASRGVSVGFKPRAVRFSADGDLAFVITEDGISVIDLTAVDQGPMIARLISVGDSFSDPLSTDVAITPDGKYALARRTDQTILRLIDLSDGAIAELDLKVLQGTPAQGDAGAVAGVLGAKALEITDVDIAPDGTFALAVARSHGALIRVPLPAGFSDASSLTVTMIEGQLVGSVSIANTGKLALAYTTAAPVEGVTIVDLVGATPLRGVRLRKSVRAVALSADGSRALVLHAKGNGSPEQPGIDEEERIDRSEGYSLIDTSSGFAKLQLTSSPVNERDLVVTADAARMFALLRDDSKGVRLLQMADLGSFQVTTTSLVAPPSSIGIVPGADRLFVGQELSGGMITFVNTQTGEVEKAVTGFELTSRIRQ